MSGKKKLLVSPLAWAKMKWFMKQADKVEISGFGTTEEGNPLHVIDFHTIKQTVDGAATKFDDLALGIYMAKNAKKGIDPSRCFRVWIHSHPFW